MSRRALLKGISLVEILVAMAIGLVVVGAVLSTYLHSKAGSRQSMAQSQVTEDAALAFGILRNHIGMAGYSQPTGFSESGMSRRMQRPAIIGCDGGFATGDGYADPKAVTCKGTPATGADSIIVRYEADASNSPMVTPETGPAAPADCAGTALAKSATPYDFYVSDSRFRIDPDATGGSALQCRGSGGMPTPDISLAAAATTPMAPTGETSNGNATLANNIMDMQIAYGVTKDVPGTPVGGVTPDPKPGKRVTAYVAAGGVGAPSSDNWDKVISVRVCLVVQSEEEVLDKATPYRGCSNDATLNTGTTTPTDRRIHRAFVTTIVLNNRI